MPAYNHERFVGAAIDSVLGQTFSDIELIVIDDGSTDETGAIVRAYDDPRIRYFHQQNQDAFNALNRGLDLCRGELISIINSDDVYAPDRLQRLVQVQKEHAAACVFSDVEPIDDQGHSLSAEQHPWLQWHEANKNYYLETKDLYDGFLHGNYMVTTSNLFVTRQLVETVGKFKELRYLHDYDYIFRILTAAEDRTIYLADEKLLQYRIHTENTIGQAAVVGREQDRMIIRQYLLQKIPEVHHRYMNTALDRLIALEHELIQVHAQLDLLAQTQAANNSRITSRVRNKLRALLGRMTPDRGRS